MSGAPGAAADPGPISVAQEAMLYHCLLAPGSRAYNETISIRKDGPLDLGALRQAFNEVVRRHGAWRTTFEVRDGRPVQVVWEAVAFDLPLLDLSALGEGAEAQAVRLVAETSRVPYDLRRGPLLRPRLVRFSEDHHRLYLAMHHLIFDGVSVYRIVLPELVALYDAALEGRPSPLLEPATTYLDYARWEQEWIEGPRAQRRLEHWRRHLAGAPTVSLPLDRRRSETARPEGSVVSVDLEAAVAGRLRALGQGVGATVFQVLAAGWAVVLACRSGQRDVVFSTAADLRQRPEFEAVVGCSLTPLVLRVEVDGNDAFGDVVLRTRNEVLDGLEHLVPFERIVRDLRPQGAPGANPLYQTMVVLEPPMASPDPSWSIHQMEPAIGDAVGAAKLDLELGLDERPDGSIEGRLVYDRNLFDRASALAILEHWVGVVRRVAEDPGVAVRHLAGAAGDRVVLAQWNATTTEPAAGTVAELVAQAAHRRPGAPAVCAEGTELTLGELVARATSTQRRLQEAGVGPGDVVALCAPVSPELVASALGVMGAGAAYLLLDPALPADRLEVLLDAAEATLVYAHPELAGRLTGATEGIGTEPRARPVAGPTCCIQFAAATDGGCQAYAFDPGTVAARCAALAADLGLGPADTVVVLAENLYRCSALELWAPLSAGARVVLAPAAAADDGAALSRLISTERASFLHAQAPRWRRLVDTGLRPARGLRALVGLPGLDDQLRDELAARTQAVFGALGGAETTGYALWGPLEADGPLTAGRPRAGTRAHVVDEDGEPLPPGVVGSLVLAGDGLASPHPRAERLARSTEPGGDGPAVVTGLRARWRHDGRLELVG